MAHEIDVRLSLKMSILNEALVHLYRYDQTKITRRFIALNHLGNRVCSFQLSQKPKYTPHLIFFFTYWVPIIYNAILISSHQCQT